MNTPDKNLTQLPKISIGLPTYNRPQALRRTLEELVNQTYQNLEIIVSDNASSEKAVDDVIKEFSLRDKRIQYFCQPENIGSINNFQFVLDKATGDFFMWIADDDWHEKTFVEELYKELSDDSSAVVAFCDFDSRDEEGIVVPGYPDFLSALKVMCEPSSFFRQVRYFLLKEGTAKPHSVYGLIRRESLAGFSWVNFIDRYGWNATDALFVFWLMTQGRLALSEKRLFGCTVGNKKSYITSDTTWTFRTYLTFIGQQIKYMYGYLRIAQGATSLTLALLFPWKVLHIFNLFAIKPGINFLKKVFCRQ